jgi:hypothetical protein
MSTDDPKKKNGVNGKHTPEPDDATSERLDEWASAPLIDDDSPFLPGFGTQDDRAVIHMTENLADVIDLSVEALKYDRGIYQRDGRLVRVFGADPPKPDADAKPTTPVIASGTPQVRELPIHTLRERMTRVARFQKWDGRKKRYVASLPIEPVIQGVAARALWPTVRELVGVIESPSMRPDGTVLETPGYDAATKYLFAPRAAFTPVKAEPAQVDAARALTELADVFCDFPFENEAARMVPIAAILTLVARPAILGAVPAFVFDAPTPGTGKSLCADAVCTIATGRHAPRATFPLDPAELEKVLAAYALQSAAVIGFDNMETGFGGAPLDKLLTAQDTVDFRVLGKTESVTARVRAVVLASGNNIVVLRDCVRRVLIARMCSSFERPEERNGFKHYPLLPFVLEHRARLVAAALTILRAFVVAGRPKQLEPLGSFEAWSELVPAAILHAGGPSVLGARPSADAGDSGETGAMRALVTNWKRLDESSGARGLSIRDALLVLYPPKRESGPPDGFDELREALEFFAPPPKPGLPPDQKRLGNQIRRFKGRNVGGARLLCAADRTGVQRWRVEHVN